MTKPAPNFNEFVRSQLRHGQYVAIAVESRCDGLGGTVQRPELHAAEVLREERAKALQGGRQQYVVVAITPSNGLFGLYEILKPNGELDFGQGNDAPADPSAGTRETAILRAERLLRTMKATENVAKRLSNREIVDYESLIAAVPTGVEQSAVLEQLKFARSDRSSYETPAGDFSAGGFDQMPHSIACNREYKVVAEILKTDKLKSGNGSVTVKIVESPENPASFPSVLIKGTQLQAEIATSNKRNSLRLFHFAACQDKNIHLSLQLDYVFSKRRWNIRVADILFKNEMIESATPVQEIFSDW